MSKKLDNYGVARKAWKIDCDGFYRKNEEVGMKEHVRDMIETIGLEERFEDQGRQRVDGRSEQGVVEDRVE